MFILGFYNRKSAKNEPKICVFQNLPKTRRKMIFMWNKSLFHQSGLRFWFWASEVPFSLHPKTAIFSNFGRKKWDFGCPNPQTETTFCRQLSTKMVEQTLVSHEYHFPASFGQILKITYFRLKNIFLFFFRTPYNPCPHGKFQGPEIALKQLFQDNFCSIKVLWNYIQIGNKTFAHGSAPPTLLRTCKK